MHAWFGKMLFVDLSSRRIETRKISSEVLEAWLGGRGLGVHLMRETIGFDAFDERMLMLFSVGPLCGTAAPTSSRLSVVSRSPLTGTIFDSSVGGHFPFKLKQAGYDAVAIAGRAASPVYIEIIEDRVTIRDAAALRGKGTGEVNRILEKDGLVACIGPAGENRARMANIMIGGANCVGRGGMGAVMGAKNLKAIVVNGSKKPSLADPALFKKAHDDVMRLLRASPVVMGELGLAEFGTGALVDIMEERRMAPTENFRKTVFSGAQAYSGPAIRKRYGSRKEGCAVCPIQCKKVTSCGRPIPEYETLSHFGGLNANDDVESIIKANLLCNTLGLDTISTAATIAAYGEARGAFLSGDAILDMIARISRREGEGDALAEGSKRYCASIGKPELSMSVKGLEIPAYDPRGSYGMALAYATSNRGACHLRAYPISQEILRKPVATDRFSFDGKARLIKICEDTNAVVDSLSVCKFAFLGASVEEYAQMLAGASGVPFTGQGLLKTGERIVDREREYNGLNGFTDDDDLLPARFFTDDGSSGEGIEITKIDKDRFREELERYHRIRSGEHAGKPAG
ncbi:MAG: aldehyde ferredoxin oxidoreductase family protein [Nitrospiraceae bacterium]|nr:aldehyde ferredoxin oxidoreductase family protein [Nitrospiraceae bacterium]